MDTQQVVARFEAERQALAMMDHPNIAKVLDAGATETGRPYFVMELVRGVPITQYCDENNLPTIERLDLFIAVCQAIQHAHQKGIIHRDIKPSNILVTLHDGVPVPKVIDFGIAKATQGDLTDKTIYTQFQQFIGTPAYISPEQAEMSGLDIDTRSDIYSLGVLLYELLTGKTPFDAKELLQAGLDEMRRTIREKEPLRPSTRLQRLHARGADHHRQAPQRRRAQADPRVARRSRLDRDEVPGEGPHAPLRDGQRPRHRPEAVSAQRTGHRATAEQRLSHAQICPPPQARRDCCRRSGARARYGSRSCHVRFFARTPGPARTTSRRKRNQGRNRARRRRRNIHGPTAIGDGSGAAAARVSAPVRKLLEAADQFASTGLSDAPAAELLIRDRMSALYLNEGPSLLDPKASYQQVKRMIELLPQVADDKLAMPRDAYRIRIAATELWAGDSEKSLAKLSVAAGRISSHPIRAWFRRMVPGHRG